MIRFLKKLTQKSQNISSHKEIKVPQKHPVPAQSKLNKKQIALLKVIKTALKESDGDKVSYNSEWLGYLPYGQYHWVSVNGKDISLRINTMDNVQSDLEQLAAFGQLTEVKRVVVEDKHAPGDVYIEYTFNDDNA